jgi:hypothetical protein
MAKFAFIVGGTIVTLVGGWLVTLGYDIITASTCTHLSPTVTIGNCRTSIVGVPLSWVHEASSNIVTTIFGCILTFGGALLMAVIFVGALIQWIRDRRKSHA